MRAFKLIRGKKTSFAPIMFATKRTDLADLAVDLVGPKNSKGELVWQPRPEWLRKPARQNHWN